MDRSTRSVAELIKRTNEITRKVSHEADDGGKMIQKSIEGIGRVSKAMTNSTTVMRELNKQTGEISGIVNTISVIAERTNLLSLNASIEAARAGDAGRGFAVVAEEIRNLADRCAKATSDIAQIVRGLENVTREATEAANDGARVADESNRLSEIGLGGLNKILSGIAETTSLVADMSRASEEQLITSRQVTEAISITNAQSRQVATATAEQAKGATSIVQASGQMRKVTKEVAQAMGEHGRAAREVVKAAQSTSSIAVQLRKAAAEQATGATQIVGAVNMMRKTGASTSRAIAEQASAVEQISKEAERLSQLGTSFTRAMREQAGGTAQINTAAESLKVQSTQAARAMEEQARAIKDISGSTQSIAKQIKLITASNLRDSQSASNVLKSLSDVRSITTKNAGETGQARNGPKPRTRTPVAAPPPPAAAVVVESTHGNGLASAPASKRRNGAKLQ